MLATTDELLVRKCACRAMSGLGSSDTPSWSTLSTPAPTPLSPPPYTPVSSEVPQSLKVGAGTVLATPGTTPVPIKKPFNWQGLSTNVNALLKTYGNVKTSQANTASMGRAAARQQEIANLTEQASAARAKAAQMAANAGKPQGMSTGVKFALGAGAVVVAAVAFKALV